ncbi:RNA polymerase sigma factor [Nannocystis punicea]|uniref:Sigma-70 family RNA polymerase sigma factor n=1 Tax=Nannocystis punicea TaxID=2995304 RepID=A0ABY7GWC9_9BACT|nr:sigma-70 family RNA polymerase sigma factor [Nannocystis poenicansa]WAS91190.1 sigma-70 family RNA polymerase sigma factor [Nannocystis poenicansa]
MSDDDADVCARAVRGDRDAFRLLVVRHQHAVHAVLAQMLLRGAVADVEDLAQETFLRVHRSLPRFEDRGPGSLKKWIVTIAARIAIDHLRRRRSQVESFDESNHPAPTAGADELARFRRLGERVEEALADLGAEQRSVLVLRQLHGLEYQEIADALQIDLGTVKSRLHRARARLHQLLPEERCG